MIRLSTLALLLGVVPAAFGNPPATAADVQKLIAKQRDLYAKASEIRRGISAKPELVKLRQAQRDAQNALNKKLDEVLKDVRAAEKKARATFDAAVEKLARQDKEIADLEKQQATIEKQRRDLQFQIGLVEVHIYHQHSPVQRALESDAELAELRKAAYAGGKGRRNAWSKYYDARKKKLAALPQAKAHMAKIENHKAEVAKLDKQRYQVWSELSKAKRELRYSDQGDLKPLREKWYAARNATAKAATQESTATLRKQANDASSAYFKKLRELTSANPDLKALEAQIEAFSKQIRELRKKKSDKPK